MMAPGIPYPDASGAGHVEISIFVHFHSVGHAIAFAAGLFSEDAALRKRSIWRHVINTNVSLLAVSHVETLSIRREGEPIGLRQIHCEQAYLAIGIQAIHALKRNLLLHSLHQVESRVGEVDRTVGADDYIVGAVEAVPLITISENLVMPAGLDSDDGAQDAGAIEKMIFAVEGISIGIAKRKDFLFAPVGNINAEYFVDFFVANVKKSRRVPDRPLCKSKPGCYGRKLRIVIQQPPKLRGFGKQFKKPFRRAGLKRGNGGDADQ